MNVEELVPLMENDELAFDILNVYQDKYTGETEIRIREFYKSPGDDSDTPYRSAYREAFNEESYESESRSMGDLMYWLTQYMDDVNEEDLRQDIRSCYSNISCVFTDLDHAVEFSFSHAKTTDDRFDILVLCGENKFSTIDDRIATIVNDYTKTVPGSVLCNIDGQDVHLPIDVIYWGGKLNNKECC